VFCFHCYREEQLMSAKQLVMYTRTLPCPYVNIARTVLEHYRIPYHEIFIDRDNEALERVLTWTGFLSVPTLVVAETGSVLPIAPPANLAKGASPRGVNRGTMLTEPNQHELLLWLVEHGFLEAEQLALG
jgi:glutaredoxin